MKDVFPNPQTRDRHPTRCGDQLRIFPNAANSAHAPKKVTYMPTTGNHRRVSIVTCGTSASTSAGSAMFSTHQLIPGTMPSGSGA